jgi:hypothetical protein
VILTVLILLVLGAWVGLSYVAIKTVRLLDLLPHNPKERQWPAKDVRRDASR